MSHMKRSHRFLLALSFGMTLAVISYVAVRMIDAALFPEPNPAIVIWSDRSRFIWRALIAAYLGGAGVFGGFGLASRTPDKAIDWLERSIIGSGIALIVQAVGFP